MRTVLPRGADEGWDAAASAGAGAPTSHCVANPGLQATRTQVHRHPHREVTGLHQAGRWQGPLVAT